MDKEEIYNTLKNVIIDLFEIDAEEITPQANLYEDLDLDSIDAVDLAVKITEITGKRVNPEDFKKVRTVQDLVDTAVKMIK
ncbi:MAG: acyl carrier protein [Alcanivoracaceae bacterium]|nr:acyl carrier protein [Alcanivoracaceae bacterium]